MSKITTSKEYQQMRTKPLAPRPFSSLRVTLVRSVPVVDSRDVAAMIEKPHKVLMRSIRQYIQYLSRNKIAPAEFFIAAEYIDEQGKKRPRFDCTRKGCDMIANKQTGERGTLFTAAYVTRFHEMDELLREKQTPDWQRARQLTKETRKTEADVIKRFVDYARSQGSKNAERYYTSVSELANKAAGIENRDFSDSERLHMLHLIERVIATALSEGMRAEKEYHHVFIDAKRAVEHFAALIGLQEGA